MATIVVCYWPRAGFGETCNKFSCSDSPWITKKKKKKNHPKNIPLKTVPSRGDPLLSMYPQISQILDQTPSSRNLSVKSKLSPSSGSVSLRQLSPRDHKVLRSFLFQEYHWLAFLKNIKILKASGKIANEFIYANSAFHAFYPPRKYPIESVL